MVPEKETTSCQKYKVQSKQYLERKYEIILTFELPRKVTMHPQVVSIAQEKTVITRYFDHWLAKDQIL